MIKFSILTPVYNREDCIGRCIESVVIKQDYENKEHIIVDDGSTDRTLNIVKKYKRNYNNISLISYLENKGINYAFNRGIEKIDESYVLILGSDDWLIEHALIKIKSIIENYPNYKHYMFIPDDKEAYVKNNPLLNDKISEVNYEDWLSGRITGDFVHVIHSSVLKKFPFFEEFRLYEGINFLRFYKYTKKQLIVNEIVVGRERNRKDALTNEAILYRTGAIENEFKALQLLFKFFENDYKEKAPERYRNIIKRYSLLGLALSKYKNVEKYYRTYSLYLKIIYRLKLGLTLKYFIRIYSFIKHLNR